MESSESHEPSYYEVALTNRQVLIAFVVLLTSIVAAFLSGVWIGRGGSSVARLPPARQQVARMLSELPRARRRASPRPRSPRPSRRSNS